MVRHTRRVMAVLSIGAAATLPWLATGACSDAIAPSDETVPSAVVRVDVQPDSVRLAEGHRAELTAIPRSAENRQLLDREIVWSSSNPAIAEVSAAGLVLAVSAGEAAISATADGVSGQAVVLVHSPEPPPESNRELNSLSFDYGGAFQGSFLTRERVSRDTIYPDHLVYAFQYRVETILGPYYVVDIYARGWPPYSDDEVTLVTLYLPWDGDGTWSGPYSYCNDCILLVGPPPHLDYEFVSGEITLDSPYRGDGGRISGEFRGVYAGGPDPQNPDTLNVTNGQFSFWVWVDDPIY